MNEDKILKIIEDFILKMEDLSINVSRDYDFNNLKIGELKDKAKEIFSNIQELRMKLYKDLNISFYPHNEKRK